RVGDNASARTRRVHVDGAFTRVELRRSVRAAHGTTILVETGIRPLLEIFPVFDLDWSVEGELGSKTTKTVFQGAELLVMNGGEVFRLDPGDPCRAQAAIGCAAVHDGLHRGLELSPGFG